MNDRIRLPSDLSRCNGVDGENKCETCKRKAQIQHDDESRWFPYTYPAVRGGRCEFWIQEES